MNVSENFASFIDSNPHNEVKKMEDEEDSDEDGHCCGQKVTKNKSKCGGRGHTERNIEESQHKRPPHKDSDDKTELQSVNKRRSDWESREVSSDKGKSMSADTSESTRGVSRGGRAMSRSLKEYQNSELDEMKNNDQASSSYINTSASLPLIIPDASIQDFPFSDYEPGSYERVAVQRRKWLLKHWSVEGDLTLLGDCTALRFCQCHRPSKRAAVLSEIGVPVLHPAHLREIRAAGQEEEFMVTFYGKTIHVRWNEHDYLVTFHDPSLAIHNVPPLMTHALSLKINQAPGVEHLVGVDVEQVSVVTRFSGYTILHYSKYTEFSAIERLDILSQIMTAVRHIHRNNYVHNNIQLSSLCLAPEGRCPHTRMRKFRVTLIDFTLCRQKRTHLLRHACHNPRHYPWLCPEVLQGDRCSEYSDVFSIGKMASVLETRRHPYPEDLRTWVSDALASKHLVRQPLGRGLRYVKKFQETLLKLYKLYRHHPPTPEANNEPLDGASDR